MLPYRKTEAQKCKEVRLCLQFLLLFLYSMFENSLQYKTWDVMV